MDEQPADTHVEAFTRRALDVLTLLAWVPSTQEIAHSLGMEVGTGHFRLPCTIWYTRWYETPYCRASSACEIQWHTRCE